MVKQAFTACVLGPLGGESHCRPGGFHLFVRLILQDRLTPMETLPALDSCSLWSFRAQLRRPLSSPRSSLWKAGAKVGSAWVGGPPRPDWPGTCAVRKMARALSALSHHRFFLCYRQKALTCTAPSCLESSENNPHGD